MRPTLADPHARHRLIAAAILVAGLVAAMVIYARAVTAPAAPLEFSPDTSKKYLRDLELYGGTANVLAVQFTEWFEGLWHGRNLAYTVAVLSALVSAGYFFFTVVLPPYREPDGPRPGDPRPEA
ncbi:MAG TPA: hypothetical protein VMT19_12335 [Thermoanaerobaculaceae bacterium]|nr:hypothetical protein [Thermoanaerobaculaceae bacterium]